MRNRAQNLVSLVILAFAVAGCGERKSNSSESTSSTNKDVMMVSGVLSLETELSGELVSLLKISEGKETELLLGPITSEADGSYVFNVDLTGPNTIEPGQILITMSRSKDESKPNVLWSYLRANGAAETSNLNVLASVAYEIGVWENDLKNVFGANDRTADVFGLTGDARRLELLDSKNILLQRLGKIVSLIAAETSANYGAIHKAIAKDILDGTLDGKNGTEIVSLLSEELYTSALIELQAVISGNEPNLDAIRAAFPAE